MLPGLLHVSLAPDDTARLEKEEVKLLPRSLIDELALQGLTLQLEVVHSDQWATLVTPGLICRTVHWEIGFKEDSPCS